MELTPMTPHFIPVIIGGPKLITVMRGFTMHPVLLLPVIRSVVIPQSGNPWTPPGRGMILTSI